MAEYLLFEDNTTMIIAGANVFYYSENSCYLPKLKVRSIEYPKNSDNKNNDPYSESDLSLLLI